MPGITDRRPEAAPQVRRWQRLGWFVLMYVAGLAATLLVAYGLKALVPGG